MRPVVSVYIATSLDNFIARDDGALDWLEGVQDAGGDDYGYNDFMDTVDAVVLGRSTYDAVLGFDVWPFDTRRVLVVTNRPLAPRHGEEAYAGALAPLMDRLGAEGARRVYLDGGHLIRQGLDEGLIDDMTLSLVPVLLGKGRPLFTRGLPESQWELVSAASHPTGLVQVRYARRR